MSQRIVCRNEDNMEVEFTYDFDPFFLYECDGITSVYNNVVTSENTMVDGSTYQGSTTKERYITIVAQMDSDYQKNRDTLYRTFKPESTGTFYYIENDTTLSIDYKVESIEIDRKGVVRNAVITLKCPDPFFKASENTVVDMATWIDAFEWIYEFEEAGKPFGERFAEIIKAIQNDSGAKGIGINILLKAEGKVVNPAIYHLESGDFVIVNTTLQAGDAILITTLTNNKNVYLISEGITTEINELLDEDSEFMQLSHGMNTLKYDASEGIGYLNVEITFLALHLGV